MTDHYEPKECPATLLGLVGLSNTKRFYSHLPALECVVEIGCGKDKHESRENYLENLCNMITVLQNHKAKLISGEEKLEEF